MLQKHTACIRESPKWWGVLVSAGAPDPIPVNSILKFSRTGSAHDLQKDQQNEAAAQGILMCFWSVLGAHMIYRSSIHLPLYLFCPSPKHSLNALAFDGSQDIEGWVAPSNWHWNVSIQQATAQDMAVKGVKESFSLTLVLSFFTIQIILCMWASTIKKTVEYFILQQVSSSFFSTPF